ncbi:MAG: UDP-2,3-diacylglucosamine diphosphatase [Bacteroidota bacterium]
MAAYFFSDVHLGLGPPEAEKAKENRLLRFLEGIRPACEELFILGDLFDFWFEYRTVIPRGYHRTLAALQAFTDAGVRVRYLVGNHDCWTDGFLETELGMELHRSPFQAEVQGKKVYLHHGDGLAPADRGYRLLKPLLRSPAGFRLYRWIHPDIGVRLARGSSRTSRAYTARKDYGEEEGVAGFARARIEAGADLVVMGHLHKPSLQRFGSGWYANLGDWITHNTYGEMKEGGFALRTWKE